MKNMFPCVCRSCGITFTGGPRAWYCPNCRIIRKREAGQRAKKNKKSPSYTPLGSVISCTICGKDIIKTSGRSMYCKECGELHLKQVDNKQSLEWARNNPQKVKAQKRAFSKQRCSGDCKESGTKYIVWDKESRKWRVRPYVDGKQIVIGRYADLAEAEKKLGEFLKSEKK